MYKTNKFYTMPISIEPSINNNKPSTEPLVEPPKPSPEPPVKPPTEDDKESDKGDDKTSDKDDDKTSDKDDDKTSECEKFSCGEPVDPPKCKPIPVPITLELAPIVSLLVNKPKVCVKNKAVCKPCFFLNQ